MIKITDELAKEWLEIIPELQKIIKTFPTIISAAMGATFILLESALSDRLATCKWTAEEDQDAGTWETECGEEFVITDGDPQLNGMKFCTYCGKKLKTQVE